MIRLPNGLGALLVLCTLAAPARPQQSPNLTPADYGKWETLGVGKLSPDGHWLAVPVSRVDGASELRIYERRRPETPVVVDEGSAPVFSDDSRWLACQIGYPETVRRKKEKASEPIHNKLGLVRLETGEVEVIDNVQSFAFADGGGYLSFHKHPDTDEEASEGPAEAEDEDPPSSDLIIRRMADGIDTHVGSVSSYAWQDEGILLALAISATDRSGNGLQLYDGASGALTVLDSAEAVYRGLSWREESDDLAALRYNTTVFTQEGYFVFQPDIVYRDRDPGPSAVECVVPAVKKVLEKGIVDPTRVGLVGHSWGGYQASYIPTRTNIFAASVAGAPLTNFFKHVRHDPLESGIPRIVALRDRSG